MENTLSFKKQGYWLFSSAIIIGVLFLLLPHIISNIGVLEFIGAFFNALCMGVIAFIILKAEFLDWFKHFSFKWILIGAPALIIISSIFNIAWAYFAGSTTENGINSVLTWSYVFTSIPFMLLGEELLSISLLYAAWKKMIIPIAIATSAVVRKLINGKLDAFIAAIPNIKIIIVGST
ncbi:similar to CAAX amino terminal membrane protease family protein, N-terminal part [Listeria monocytogenes SLCC2376]|nr:similar to CAAX amino terminal membrane protease family protein, N-terminal part [Listeria monocytogenes SLCC2376]